MKIFTPDDLLAANDDGDELGDEVVFFPEESREGYDPKLLLRGMARLDLDQVLVVGVDDEGEMFLCSNMDAPEVIHLIEKIKLALLIEA